MDDSMAEVKDLFTKVSAKTKTIPVLIRRVNQVLAGFNSEIPVWLEDNPLETGDYEEDRREDRSIRRWRKASLLGFCKVKNGWELAIQDVEFEIDMDDWGNECKVVTQRSSPTALIDADEDVQRRAVYLISDIQELFKSKARGWLRAIERTEQLSKDD